jgi:hypothetical protein
MAVFVLASSTSPYTQQVYVEFDDGTVTIRAVNAPVPQILEQWSRQGRTRIVGGESLGSTSVTVELTKVPERQALETLLSHVAGYVIGLRTSATTETNRGRSTFSRIHILATSMAPAASVSPAASQALRLVPVDETAPSAGYRLAGSADVDPVAPIDAPVPDRLIEPVETVSNAAAAGDPPSRLGSPGAGVGPGGAVLAAPRPGTATGVSEPVIPPRIR